MTYLSLPRFSLSLDLFGLVIVLIIFISALSEHLREKNGSRSFLRLLMFTILTLAADIVTRLGEGRPEYRAMTLLAATLAACFCFLAVLCFLNYLRKTLYPSNRVVIAIFAFLCAICLSSVGLLIGNLFSGYASYVNEAGHLVHRDEVLVAGIYLTFPVLSFLGVLLAPPFARNSPHVTRFSFLLYALFPVVGSFADFCIHGLSMTYAGFVLSVLLIYTGIYRQKQKMIADQQNALMLSQINPHFMYNTLSTIAAMCDIDPTQAKQLTLEFSQYLRRNLTTLTCEDLIPLSQEMNHVECYLKIEKARFQERVNVLYSIHCEDFYVPPLTVQPIVENAVRHGITRKAEGGTVRIAAYSAPKHYVIEVRDDGVGFDTRSNPNDNRKHVGLENVSGRIRRMCHGRLVVRSVIGVGTRVTIVIPKKFAHPKETTHEYTGR